RVIPGVRRAGGRRSGFTLGASSWLRPADRPPGISRSRSTYETHHLRCGASHCDPGTAEGTCLGWTGYLAPQEDSDEGRYRMSLDAISSFVPSPEAFARAQQTLARMDGYLEHFNPASVAGKSRAQIEEEAMEAGRKMCPTDAEFFAML